MAYRTRKARLISLVHSVTQQTWGYIVYEILDPIQDSQQCFIAVGGALSDVVEAYAAPTINLAYIRVLSKYQQRGLGALLTIAALSHAKDEASSAVVIVASPYMKRIVEHLGFEAVGVCGFTNSDVRQSLERVETVEMMDRALHKLQESDYCWLWRVWRSLSCRSGST